MYSLNELYRSSLVVKRVVLIIHNLASYARLHYVVDVSFINIRVLVHYRNRVTYWVVVQPSFIRVNIQLHLGRL